MITPRVLLIGHYPLDRLDRAPKVRTYQMAQAFARHAQVTVIAGTRRQRRRWLLRALARGILNAVDLVYVESASSAATGTDLFFLWRVKQRGIPLAIFVRDAYQRFPGLYPQRTLKHRFMKRLYDGTLCAYGHLATQVYFPTKGLAQVVGTPSPELLPPAGVVRERPKGVTPLFGEILYVGAAGTHDGVDWLLEAIPWLRARHPSVHVTLIMRPEEWPQSPLPEGVSVVAAAGDELAGWLWRGWVAVIPRHDTAYNRLALPVKLLEYWSYHLPVVVTGPSEAAELVSRTGAGVVTEASVDGLARGLDDVMRHPEKRMHMARAAARAIVEDHNWDVRARHVLRLIELRGKRGQYRAR